MGRGMVAQFHASAGPLPSGRSMAAVPKEAMRRGYYQTASMRDLSWKAASADDRGENFNEIHSIGKRKTTYMEYPRSTAPLIDRTSCNYHRDFVPMPVNDSKINSMLAESFKANTGAGFQASPAPLNNRTVHEDTFTMLTAEERRLTVNKPEPPKWLQRTRTLGGSGVMTETRSHTQMNYSVPRRDLARGMPAAQPQPCWALPGSAFGGLAPKTSYQELGQRVLRGSCSSPQLAGHGSM